MRFGPCPAADAVGAVLAHSLNVGGETFKKGRVLSAADVAALLAAGVAHPVVARLEPSDVPEDAAAARLAAAASGAGLLVAQAFTGRCNLTAAAPGLVQADPIRLVALNRVDEAITLATLAPFARVEAGQMVATIKIIPFAVPEASLAAALALLAAPLVSVAPFAPRRAGLVLTGLPGQKASVLEKRQRAVADRLARLGSDLTLVLTVPHDEAAVAAALEQAAAGTDMLLVFGASAIVDRGDVVPAAVRRAGGQVRHLGMPVDPGNLLMLGELAGRPVIGVPSCAASPKENGFDWVLERLCAGLDVSGPALQAMAPGGLLMEIDTRPQPRSHPSGGRPDVPQA